MILCISSAELEGEMAVAGVGVSDEPRSSLGRKGCWPSRNVEEDYSREDTETQK